MAADEGPPVDKINDVLDGFTGSRVPQGVGASTSMIFVDGQHPLVNKLKYKRGVIVFSCDFGVNISLSTLAYYLAFLMRLDKSKLGPIAICIASPSWWSSTLSA